MSSKAYGYIEEGKVFRKGFLLFPDKPIGEVKTDEFSSIAYFEDRFKLAENKVEELERAVSAAENKGSYLMKLIHLKEYLVNLDALGDFEGLFVRLEKLEAELNQLIAENRANNLKIKQNLLEEASALKGSTNWKDDTEKFKALKQEWIKTGNVEREYQEALEKRFSETVDDFFTRRQHYYQEKHQLVLNKVYELKRILAEAKLASRKPVFEAKNQLKRLQEQWNKVGKVPGSMSRGLYQEFKRINNFVFKGKPEETARYYKNEADRDPRKALSEKREMIGVAQEMTFIPYPTKEDVEKVKILQQEWKQKGALPPPQNKTLSEAFYAACNLVVEKHFLNGLARNKFQDFNNLSEKERLKLKLQLARELLTRDQNELETFQENLQKLNSNTHSVNKMVNSKLSQQQRKVKIKKMLIDELAKEIDKN